MSTSEPAQQPKTARCRVCGRRLTNPESVEAGIGPVCSAKERAFQLLYGEEDDGAKEAETVSGFKGQLGGRG